MLTKYHDISHAIREQIRHGNSIRNLRYLWLKLRQESLDQVPQR